MGGRFLRSRDAHHVRVFATAAGSLGLVKPDPRKNDMNYIQAARSPARGPRSRWVPRPARRQRPSRPVRLLRPEHPLRLRQAAAPAAVEAAARAAAADSRFRPADREAAVRQHQRDQPGQGRDPLADRARRHAGQRPESSGAEGPEHPAHRPGRHHRDAGHQDAGHRGRSASDDGAAIRAARCCARTTRRPAKTPARCSCRRSRAARR